MDWAWFGSDFVLLATALALLLAEFTYRGERVRLVGPILGLAWLLQALSALVGPWDEQVIAGVLVVDGVSRWFRVFAVAVGMFASIMILQAPRLPSRRKVEGLVFLVGSVLACHYLVGSRDALVSGLAWTALWVCSGFLLGLEKRDALVLEIGLKQILGLGILLITVGLFVIGLLVENGSTQLPLDFAASPFTPSLVPLCALVLLGLGAFPFHTRFPNIASSGLAAAAFPVLALSLLGPVGFYSRVATTFGQQLPATWSGPIGQFGFLLLILLLLGQLIAPWVALAQKNARRASGHLWAANVLWLASWILIKGSEHSGLWVVSLIVQFCGLGAVWFGEAQIERQGETRFAKIMIVMGIACLCGVPPLPTAVFHWGLIESAFEHGDAFVAAVLTVSWLISILAFAKLSQARVSGILKAPTLENRTAQWIGILVWLPVVVIGLCGDQLATWIGRTIPRFFW